MSLDIPVREPAEFFPVAIEEQVSIIASAVSKLSDKDIAWISENRDFSEAERYREKDEVDEALVASSTVSDERGRIERLFEANEPVNAGDMYLVMFRNHMASLHRSFAGAVATTKPTETGLDTNFWRQAIAIADADNAHAMYLSSDNWSFSVFHKLIDELANFVGDDQALIAPILLAGIQDVRTSVYCAFGNLYRGLNRLEFIGRIRDRADWARHDGIMPIFAFKAATEGMPDNVRRLTALELRQQYKDSVEFVVSKLNGSCRRRFIDICNVYQRLYAARAAYDIYEYFGFYAFARHLLILRGMRALEGTSIPRAKLFHYSASTYQFSKLNELINTNDQEARTQ